MLQFPVIPITINILYDIMNGQHDIFGILVRIKNLIYKLN
jgi:hypothetical protein